jgi:hypothetical protein
MENFCLAVRLGFEQLTSRLPREHSHERPKCIINSRLTRLGRDVTNDLWNTSSSLSSFASSFGHDTPAHVERRFAIRGVRYSDEWAALSAAPNASSLASSAEGVFRALIATTVDRQCSCCDRINLSDSGSCRKEALERHSEALHIGRCEGCAVWHERDTFKIRLVAIGVNRILEAHRTKANSSGAQAGSTPAGRAGRTVEAQRRALTPPSTARKFRCDGRVIRGSQEER